MRHHKEQSRELLTPRLALEFLKDGNSRFCKNLSYNRDNQQIVMETATGQWPFAAVLNCSDSRLATELIFDQGIGDIFSIRLAGNVASPEYTCKVLYSKLIVVLGHTNCGAVTAACNNVQMGNLEVLLKHINPAIESKKETISDRNGSNEVFLNNVLHNNVHQQIETIINGSGIIRELLENQQIGIIGGMYDISTGEVEFFEETFDLEHFNAETEHQTF
jgi:carbonic anhydrase